MPPTLPGAHFNLSVLGEFIKHVQEPLLVRLGFFLCQGNPQAPGRSPRLEAGRKLTLTKLWPLGQTLVIHHHSLSFTAGITVLVFYKVSFRRSQGLMARKRQRQVLSIGLSPEFVLLTVPPSPHLHNEIPVSGPGISHLYAQTWNQLLYFDFLFPPSKSPLPLLFPLQCITL